MARWISVRKPFDFYWSHRAITAFTEAELGDQFVKDEIADFAVAKGYATEGKLDEASRSTKGKKAKRTKKAAETADSGSGATVGNADAADADRPADRPAMASDAE